MSTGARILTALIILGAIGMLVTPTLAAESVSILKPSVYPDEPENRALINKVIQWSVTRANDLYGGHITVDYNQRAQRAEYSVMVSASFSGDDSVITVQMIRNRNGSEAESVPILGQITAQTAIHLTNSVFYQWSSFHDYLRDELEAPPVYVEEIQDA